MQKKQNNKPSPKKGNKGKGPVKAPVAMNMSSKNRAARQVVHRECERVGTVVGSVAFASVGNFAINPGLADSFPWLSGLAQHYERYRIDAFTVRYKNLKGTDTDGNILMSFDYDTLDAGPTTAVVQTQSTIYVDGAPWRIFEMKIPPDGLKKYIRSSLIGGADLKTYDFGRVWISAEGCADTSDHGYLEFEYSVSLFEKQTAGASSVVNRTWSQWNLSTTASLSASAVIDIDEPLLLASPSLASNVNGTVTLSVPGYYLITAEWTVVNGVDTDSFVDIRVNGAIQNPPLRSGAMGCGITGQASGSLSAVVLSDGTTTIDLYYTDGTATHNFQADTCRLGVLAI